MKILLTLLLAIAVCAQKSFYTINSNCVSNSTGNFLTLQGGPFGNNLPQPIPYQINYNCSAFSALLRQAYSYDLNFPMTFTISCGQVCSSCGYAVEFPGSSFSFMYSLSGCASDGDVGSFIQVLLDNFYQIAQQNEGATYNWCGVMQCSPSPSPSPSPIPQRSAPSSTMIIILAVVFGIVGLIAIISGIAVLCANRKYNGVIEVQETARALEMEMK